MIALTVSGPAQCARSCRVVYSGTTSWVDAWFLTRVEAVDLCGGMRYGLLHPATTVVWFYRSGVSKGSNRLHHVRVLQIPLPASERLAIFAIAARLHPVAAWICDHDEPARSIEGRCSKGRKFFRFYAPNDLHGAMQRKKAIQEEAGRRSALRRVLIANRRLRPSQASSRRSWARTGRVCDAGSQDQAHRPDPGQR
jgi:hypothetical protein